MGYKGRYDRTIYHDPVSGYCVVSMKTADTSVPEKARSRYRHRDRLIRFTATGYKLPLTNAVEISLDGEWAETKHGTQLTVAMTLERIDANQLNSRILRVLHQTQDSFSRPHVNSQCAAHIEPSNTAAV